MSCPIIAPLERQIVSISEDLLKFCKEPLGLRFRVEQGKQMPGRTNNLVHLHRDGVATVPSGLPDI
jgi:hypothetical protein